MHSCLITPTRQMAMKPSSISGLRHFSNVVPSSLENASLFARMHGFGNSKGVVQHRGATANSLIDFGHSTLMEHEFPSSRVTVSGAMKSGPTIFVDQQNDFYDGANAGANKYAALQNNSVSTEQDRQTKELAALLSRGLESGLLGDEFWEYIETSTNGPRNKPSFPRSAMHSKRRRGTVVNATSSHGAASTGAVRERSLGRNLKQRQVLAALSNIMRHEGEPVFNTGPVTAEQLGNVDHARMCGLGPYMDGNSDESALLPLIEMSSVLKKRGKKMRKHKLRKRRRLLKMKAKSSIGAPKKKKSWEK